MKYSVIIPLFNIVGGYLNECVMSVINQNRTDVEIILVNDGSTDNSLDICNYFKKNYKNIKVIDKKNTGSMDSWIKGVENAIGKYIVFVDADDMIADNFFDEIDKYTTNDIIVFDFFSMYKNGTKKEKVNKINYGKMTTKDLTNLQNYYYIDYEKYSLYRWDKVIKADIIKKNIKEINYKCIYFEDHPISFLNLLESKSLYYINKPLYYYRMRKSSVSHSINEKIFKDNINIEKEMINIAKKYNYNAKQLDNIHLYFLFQYARWALKAEKFPEYNIKVKLKDIKNIKSIKQKIIVILYKFRLKKIFRLFNFVNHFTNDYNKNYFE